MSKKERQLLRLYSAIHAIPRPSGIGGTQSASVQGHISYANDMAEVQPFIEMVVHHIRVNEGIQAEHYLDALEKWIETRKAQGWQLIFPHAKVLVSWDEE